MATADRGRGNGLMRADPLPAPEDKRESVRRMFDRISGRYDIMNRLISLGMDMRWRRAAVATLSLPTGSRVLDLACGTGDICRLLADRGHRPIGLDISLGMLEHARTNAPLMEADALRIPVGEGAADGITCGFGIRNVTDIGTLFEECARVLRTGGRVALLEVAEPTNPVVRAGHRLYFHHLVPALGGLLVDQQAYRYLPRSLSYLPPPRELAVLLERTGFEDIEQREVATGLAQIISATRR